MLEPLKIEVCKQISENILIKEGLDENNYEIKIDDFRVIVDVSLNFVIKEEA